MAESKKQSLAPLFVPGYNPDEKTSKTPKYAYARENYEQLNAALLMDSTSRENLMTEVADKLPKEHIVSAQHQFQQMEAFIDQTLDEVNALNANSLKLKEKIKNNLNTPDKRFGYLKHNLEAYMDCIPLLNADQLSAYLNEDRAVWKTYYEKAEEEARLVSENIAKLLEE